MAIIDRYIDFGDWPANRKTLVLAGAASVTHAITSASTAYFTRQADISFQDKFDDMHVAGFSVTVICALLAWISVRLNQEGRWTAYVTSVLYSAWLIWMISTVGAWSSPMAGSGPLFILLMTLWYDMRVGIFSMFCFVAGLIVMIALNHYGILPYAYAMRERSIDAQGQLEWAVATVTPYLGYFFFVFILGVMTLIARARQDERLAEAHKLIRRYVPEQIADQILTGEQSEAFRPVRAKLTIFFSDVEGFTDVSDKLDPEGLSVVLNEYMSAMAEVAEQHGATINQFIGDGIMVFFGAPHATSDRDHALRAVRMARDMQARMQLLNESWEEHGIREPFRARMGIHTGYASVGDYGSEGRKIYSAIGVQVNIASRIQTHCEPGKILVSDSTYSQIRDEIDFIDKGEIEIRGVHYPIHVYEVKNTLPAGPD